MTEGLCWISLTGEGKVKLRDVEIDTEVTAEIYPKDSNILIADVLKFNLSWGGSPFDTIDVDFNYDLGIIDMIIKAATVWYELLTNGISEKMNELREMAKNIIIDKIPFCATPDGKCRNEGQL